MPFDCGLPAGVVIGTRCKPLGRAQRVERGVDAAVVTQPLDRRVGAPPGAEAGRHGVLHELLDVGAARDPARRSTVASASRS